MRILDTYCIESTANGHTARVVGPGGHVVAHTC
jgi:hypothetical protein